MPFVDLYLHTHWDREWYLPFESFRIKLLELVRSLIVNLEKEEIPHFYLDGQACVLHDLFEIDPKFRTPLTDLVKTGKLAIGPWYVLPDQMLVSGESLVRNLKLGIETCEQVGGATAIGYSPDTFGQSQDLPRILQGFNIDFAVAWRGVPPLPEGPHFRWLSPDGSSVLCYHFTNGYYQTRFHETEDLDLLRRHILDVVTCAEPADAPVAQPYCRPVDSYLFPVGADHLGPPVTIAKVLKGLNRKLRSDGITVRITPLDRYLQGVADAIAGSGTVLREIQGELRDNTAAAYYRRAYLLPGVLSSRMYLKSENRQAEIRLFHLMEPLLTLLEINGTLAYPADELRYLLRLLLENHPHDSICGCSVDDVHTEMQTRYRKIHHALDALEDRAKSALALDRQGMRKPYLVSCDDPAFAADTVVVFNLSTSPFSGPVKVSYCVEPGTPADAFGVQLEEEFHEERLFADIDIPAYYKDVIVRSGYLWAHDVPPMGARSFQWEQLGGASSAPALTCGESSIKSDLLTVQFEEGGRLLCRVEDPGGREYCLEHFFKDMVDLGDEYSFDPAPEAEPVLSRFSSVSLLRPAGPLVASLSAKYTMKIERTINAFGDKSSSEHELATKITVKAGSPIVHFETAFFNSLSGHRLEVCFNTGAQLSSTLSENHYSVVSRPAAADTIKLPVASGHEASPDRFPCQRFFIANAQAFFNMGLPEYAAAGQHVMITLLRSVDRLSKGVLLTRGGGAGPHVLTPGAQCLGPVKSKYGWAALAAAGSADDSVALAYQLAELYEDRVWAAFARGQGPIEDKSFFAVDNPCLRMTALYFDPPGQRVILRLLNVTASPQSAHLYVQRRLGSASICRLDGTVLADLPLEDKGSQRVARLDAGVNQLITLSFKLH